MQPRGGRLESWRRRRGAGQHATQRRPARELAAETRCRATCNPEAPGSRVGGGDDPANRFANTSLKALACESRKGAHALRCGLAGSVPAVVAGLIVAEETRRRRHCLSQRPLPPRSWRRLREPRAWLGPQMCADVRCSVDVAPTPLQEYFSDNSLIIVTKLNMHYND
jgi:hypothetical protein